VAVGMGEIGLHVSDDSGHRSESWAIAWKDPGLGVDCGELTIFRWFVDTRSSPTL
jgi:hypothetical protein